MHRSIETVHRRPPAADLEEIARAIAARLGGWRELARHDPDRRWFVQLYRTTDIEAWLLTWPATRGIELHDHGGSRAVVHVLDGHLDEHFTDLATRAPLRRRRWHAGDQLALPASHVHDVHNRGGRPATSIHVYSPPLATMTFYEHATARFLEPLRSEPARGGDRPPVVAS
jgi:predicted metal-dependent enzyme (double-stranded beta helix superfamily)